MANVEFESMGPVPPQYEDKKSGSFVTNLILKLGLAESEKGANRVMVVISILALIITVWLIVGIINDSKVEAFQHYAQEQR
jgi:hypothetical protein